MKLLTLHPALVCGVGAIMAWHASAQSPAPAPVSGSPAAVPVPVVAANSPAVASPGVPVTGPQEPKPPANLQQMRPNALPYRIERRAFGPNDSFKRVEIFWVPVTTKPKAFLVLAHNMLRPRVPLEDRQWVEFAQKQNLGIMSVGFDEVDAVARISESADDLGNRIYKVAAEAYGPGIKGTTFGSGLGGAWMHRVIMRKPWLWGFWCTRDVQRYPVVPRYVDYPAGLVIATKSWDYDDNLFFFQDLRRVKNANRVGFVCVDGSPVDAAYLDRFGRNYLTAVLAGESVDARWMDIHTKVNCGTLEKPPSAIVQSWVPGDETLGAWKLLHRERKRYPDCQVAFADVKAPEGGSPIKLVFRVPGKVKVGTGVRQVMICVLWAQDDVEFEKKLRSSTDFKASEWERARLGVIGINAKAYGFPADLPNAMTPVELEKLAARVKAHAPELWSVVGKANGELGWRNGEFCLMGAGIGAHIAQCMAYSDPVKFAAVHLHAGAVYLPLKSELAKTPWFITSGGKHAGYEATVKFYTSVRKAGWPVQFNAFSGSTGGMEDWVWGGGARFFRYLGDLADVVKKDITEGRRKTGETAATLFVENLSKPHVVADLATRKFVLAKNVEQIPEANRVTVPNLALEEAVRIVGAPRQLDAAGNPIIPPSTTPPAPGPAVPAVAPPAQAPAPVPAPAPAPATPVPAAAK